MLCGLISFDVPSSPPLNISPPQCILLRFGVTFFPYLLRSLSVMCQITLSFGPRVIVTADPRIGSTVGNDQARPPTPEDDLMEEPHSSETPKNLHYNECGFLFFTSTRRPRRDLPICEKVAILNYLAAHSFKETRIKFPEVSEVHFPLNFPESILSTSRQ